MRVDVTTTVEIARPRDEVASYAADPTNATVWYRNIRRIEWETRPPVAVGSRVAFVAQFLGRPLAYTCEVEVLEPDTRLVMRADQGPFPMETSYEWHDTPHGGTRMTLRHRGEPTGFSSIVAPMLVVAMRRANMKDLSTLRRVLERQQWQARRAVRDRPAAWG